jgi:hypothetical protein
MLEKWRSRVTYANVASTAALVLAMSGFAVAAVPGSGRVIHGCYSKRGGSLRVVAASAKCARSESAISWNQQGPRGPVGAKGAAGQAGRPGANGTNGTNGAPGASGAPGPTGPTGPTGARGPSGPTGPTGPSGVTLP